MPQLLVRNVPEETVAALKRRASANGRSVEAEHRALLEEALPSDVTAWLERARELRLLTAGRKFTPSEVLIRESRDSN